MRLICMQQQFTLHNVSEIDVKRREIDGASLLLPKMKLMKKFKMLPGSRAPDFWSYPRANKLQHIEGIEAVNIE